jgi:hypothetical protein
VPWLPCLRQDSIKKWRASSREGLNSIRIQAFAFCSFQKYRPDCRLAGRRRKAISGEQYGVTTHDQQSL